MAEINDFRTLWIYHVAFDAAMEIFEQSKGWPREERYALMDQTRRAPRAVCASVAEAWRKRRYPKHFITKLSDADAKAAEVQNWLTSARACGYLDEASFHEFDGQYHKIAAGLPKMMGRPEPWCGSSGVVREAEASYDAWLNSGDM